MKVLIVDDQPFVVSGIEKGIDWEILGVTEVYKAYSGTEAIKVISNNKIDLVITDIEMPGMDGLELARWIAIFDPKIGVIFLTSHSSFDYAQTAIKIGCYNYILQPVDYRELQVSIKKVIELMKEKYEKEKMYENGKRWEDVKEDIKENSWRKIICTESGCTASEIQSIIQRSGYKVDWQQKYQMVLIILLGQNGSLDDWRANKAEEFAEYIAEENLGQNLRMVLTMKVMMDGWLCLFLTCDLLPHLQRLVELGEKKYHYRIACYCSELVEIYKLHEEYMRLCSMKKENVASYSGIFKYQVTQNTAKYSSFEICKELSFEEWKQKLLNHEEDKIRDELNNFLNRKQMDGSLDLKVFIILQQMLFNAFYNLYNWNKYEFANLLESNEISALYVNATESIEKFYEFVDIILKKNKEIGKRLPAQDKGEELVEKIKHYILNRLNQKLTRKDIADHFFLSRDYVTHIFKKYTGDGLIQFINTQKMNKAKELLLQTDISVHGIASKVGIADYAYFFKLFRKETGMTATEYRNKYRQE